MSFCFPLIEKKPSFYLSWAMIKVKLIINIIVISKYNDSFFRNRVKDPAIVVFYNGKI